MHRALVDTEQVAKFITLPEDLKNSKTLELLITPVYPDKKAELKKRLAAIFKKAKQTKIHSAIAIDDLMNEMNNALH